MPTGVVKKFIEEKGFGFIVPDDGGEDVFVHRKVNGGDRTAYLEEGDKVTYELEWDDRKGNYAASACTGFKTGGGGGGGGGGGDSWGRNQERAALPMVYSNGVAAHQEHGGGAGGAALVPRPPRGGKPSGLIALLRAYDEQLTRKPLPTKLLTAAVMNLLSELLSRRATGRKGTSADLARQCVIGMGLNAIMHRWYAVIERMFAGWPSDALSTVGAKMALQMTFLEPVMATLFISLTKLLSGQLDIATPLRESLAKVVVSAWVVWGPTSAMQYRFVPEHYRTLVNCVVGLFHTMYVITTTRGA